ncbi:MAG: hypothetical protein ACFFD3_01480 [Candidatus Thorarchaeota archaeon]
MGVKEKRREKKSKTEEKVDEVKITEAPTIPEVTLDVAEEEKKIHRPEVVITTPIEDSEIAAETESTEVKEAVAEVKEECMLPSWGDSSDSEWMYHIPARDEDKILWAEEWGDFLLEWAQAGRIHVISVSAFLKEKPFSEMLGKVDAFRMIGDMLVQKEVADWLDRGRRQLRVYWRPLEEWADIVYEWALKTGNLLLDVKSIVIQESGEDFAQLPEADIEIVLGFIVQKGLAAWVDKKKGAIKIEI